MDQYNTLTPEIISKLKAVSDHILTGDDINPDFSRDEMPIYGTHMPDLVVQPRSTEEVAAAMKICYKILFPLHQEVPELTCRRRCSFLAVFFDMSKMNRILKL